MITTVLRECRTVATWTEKVRAVMKREGISTYELAKRTGQDRTTISRLISQTKYPYRKTIERFSACLGVEPEEILPESKGVGRWKKRGKEGKE